MTTLAGSYVVVGAGAGLGRATARLLVERGADVVVCFDSSEPALEWVATEATSRIVPVVGDATDEAALERAADLAEQRSALAGWVNNAASYQDGIDIHAHTAADLMAMISANLTPAVAGCAVAVRRMVRDGRGGAVVNTSSTQAHRPLPGNMTYAVAKAGIEALTRSLASEYGRSGIRLNAVAPGTFRSPASDAYLATLHSSVADRLLSESGDRHALGRIGETPEVATAIVFLLSAEAAFVTGTTLFVDGGRSILDSDPV